MAPEVIKEESYTEKADTYRYFNINRVTSPDPNANKLESVLASVLSCGRSGATNHHTMERLRPSKIIKQYKYY
jgi:hypothetical protein